MGYYHELKLRKLMQENPNKSAREIPKGCRGCMYFQPDWKYRKCTWTKCCYGICKDVFRKHPLENDKTCKVVKKNEF